MSAESRIVKLKADRPHPVDGHALYERMWKLCEGKSEAQVDAILRAIYERMSDEELRALGKAKFSN